MDSKEQENMPAICELQEDEADNFSYVSRVSDGGEQTVTAVPATATASTNSVESYALESSSMRVRDMINLYNLATARNQELSQAKSMYFGVNKCGKPFESDGQQARQEEETSSDVDATAGLPTCADEEFDSVCGRTVGLKVHHDKTIECPLQSSSNSSIIGQSSVNKCSASANRSSESSICHQTTKKSSHSSCNSTQSRNKSKGFRIMTSDGQTSLKQQGGNEDGTPIMEMAYQSKTTIKKTEGGVRIVIDIFFDKEHDIDEIVGSRVETDIPESRILSDFQKHTDEMRGRRDKH